MLLQLGKTPQSTVSLIGSESGQAGASMHIKGSWQTCDLWRQGDNPRHQRLMASHGEVEKKTLFPNFFSTTSRYPSHVCSSVYGSPGCKLLRHQSPEKEAHWHTLPYPTSSLHNEISYLQSLKDSIVMQKGVIYG